MTAAKRREKKVKIHTKESKKDFFFNFGLTVCCSWICSSSEDSQYNDLVLAHHTLLYCILHCMDLY